MRKKVRALLAAVLLLAIGLCACGGQKQKTAKEQTPEPSPTASPVVTPSPLTSEPVETTPEETEELVRPAPTTEPDNTEPEEELTLEEAKTLIEQANAALAPFLGEGAVECDQEGWLLLEGYSAQEELLEGLKGPFANWLAKCFYESYAPLILKEAEGKVYVRSNSRDIIGHYYDMDLETIEYAFDEWSPWYSYIRNCFVNGAGNGTDVIWQIGFDIDGIWKIAYYGCDGGTGFDFAIVPGGKAYTVNDVGSPEWLGEPESVEEGVRDYWGNFEYRIERYPGFSVTLEDIEGSGKYIAHYITVDGPGVPTDRGIEIGATLKEFLIAYPQFNMAAANDWMIRSDEENLIYARRYPLINGDGAPSCPMIDFFFNENFILESMYLHYSESN